LLRLGISKVIRRGSTLDAVEPILRGVLEEGIPTEHLMFCCDDAYVNDLMREGHVNAMIQGAISAGLDPIKAIKMGSFNAARHFHMEDRLGSLTPGRFADIVLLKDLEEVRPTHVFHAGELVAQDGELLQELRWAYPQLRVEPRPGLQGLRPQDLALHASGRAEVPLLDLTAQPPITSTATLEASQGRLEADPQRDLLKLCLLERYPQGERQIRKLFAHGFSLHEGALAISFTQGGPQITAVGADDGDMVLAAKAVDAHPGGLALAAHGEVLGTLPLPLAGMMSDLPTREVAARLERLHQAARELGCDLPSPFMTLWFAPFHLRR
jgi:adenine deaminase